MADSSDFTNLTKAAKGNHIRLKDGAAEDCAKKCSALIHELTLAINDADKLATVTGFGNGHIIKNADDLAGRYKDRAIESTGGDSSLQHALKRHRDLVNDMMDTFIAAGRAYLMSENASTKDFDSTVNNLPRS